MPTGKFNLTSLIKTAAVDPAQTILITGHSGSGKTTLSKHLAEKLNLPLHRVDAQTSWDDLRAHFEKNPELERKALTPGTAENRQYIRDVRKIVHRALKEINGPAVLEGTQLTTLPAKQLAKYKANILVGGDMNQSIAQRLQRMTDKAAKKGITLSPEQLAKKREESQLVAGSWHPGMEKFKKLPGVLNYNHSEHQIDPLVKQLKHLIGKQAEYKWHKSKDLHRDVTNGRHYPFSFLTGEAKELVDAIKKRDMANFKEEIGDTSYAAQMLAAQATGLNHPVYADLSKFHNREKIWKDIFKEKGSIYHPKHMEGGSNFAKPSKIIKALASAGIRISQKEAEKLANKYTGGKMEKEAAVAAWQRSEGKNPEGGLNAKGRASYKKETGGTLKAPVGESNPTGDRAKRQNSFCSRMCGMKSKNTGSKAQSDPDSRINKSLRKWNCKCGEDHSSLFEKVACLIKESKGRCWEGYAPVPGKEPYSNASCKPVAKKRESELEKEAADSNELRKLILAAYKGSQSSKQSLSAMGSKKGPRKPISLPKPSRPATDLHKERHQGIFPFLGSHQAEIAKNTIDPTYVMDPSKYLGKQADEEEPSVDVAKLRRKFKYWATKMRDHGVMAGTYHKRIAIPKKRLSEDNLKQLGFEPVAVAIPEAGQDQFASYRNPNNLFHLHSHGDHWTMHEDEHPSLTMALRNAPIEKVPEAVVSGLSHITTEGLPGAYKYISNRLTGSGSMLDAVMNETTQQKNKLPEPVQM